MGADPRRLAHDGYVEVRDPSDSEAKKVADDVNAKRKDLYEKRASDQGVAPEDVGRVYATQIMQKAPKGTWFLDENKKWKQK